MSGFLAAAAQKMTRHPASIVSFVPANNPITSPGLYPVSFLVGRGGSGMVGGHLSPVIERKSKLHWPNLPMNSRSAQLNARCQTSGNDLPRSGPSASGLKSDQTMPIAGISHYLWILTRVGRPGAQPPCTDGIQARAQFLKLSIKASCHRLLNSWRRISRNAVPSNGLRHPRVVLLILRPAPPPSPRCCCQGPPLCWYRHAIRGGACRSNSMATPTPDRWLGRCGLHVHDRLAA